MNEVLIPMLAFLVVVGVGGVVLVVRSARKRELEARLSAQPSRHRHDPVAGGARPRIVNTLEHVGRAVSHEQPAKDLRATLAQAGHYGDNAPTIYIGAQVLLVVIGITIFVPLALALSMPWLIKGCIAFAGIALLILLPNIVVSVQRRRRAAQVRGYLPDAIDLLEICVSSGMGIDMAWNAVTDEFRGVSPILADEMALTNLEINLGAPRADALRHMANRTGVEDLSSLVATLIQSERFGTSISQALRTFADGMRTERSQRAEEAAEKLMVTMLFPMVLFIFPVILLVILGPAGIKIAEVFANG